MKNNRCILALAATVLLLGSNLLWADGDQPWHVSYMIGGANLDNVRDTDDGDIWQGIGFGYFLGPHFSLDLEYDKLDSNYRNYNVKVPGASYKEWNFETLSAVGRYYFGSNAWKPYVLATIGSTKRQHQASQHSG